MFNQLLRPSASYVTFLVTLFLVPIADAADVGGTVLSDTVWTADEGPYRVVSNLTVPGGLELRIEAGTVVRLLNGVSISAQADATIAINGTPDRPVRFLPDSAGVNWGTIKASGGNSTITIRHAEIDHGGVNLGSQSIGLIEDTYVHDVGSAIVGNSAKMVTMRRVHVNRYSETIFNSGTIVLAEDSLFENQSAGSSDALEIQNGPLGSIIRRCTFRHSIGGNSDAIDCNGSTGVLIHDCLIYDISDKGLSFGTATAFNQPPSVDIVVSNCLVYNVDSCIAVKDKSNASLFNDTFVDSPFGVRLYQKYSTPVAGGGGRIAAGSGNIIWGNTTDLDIATNSEMNVTYCDLGGSGLAGEGNITGDPLFLDRASRDYRLSDGSPAAGTGRDGANMGAHFPVGAPMALSHPRIEFASVSAGVATIGFWADSERSYALEASDVASGGSWTSVTNIPVRALPVLIQANSAVGPGNRFFRLRTP